MNANFKKLYIDLTSGIHLLSRKNTTLTTNDIEKIKTGKELFNINSKCKEFRLKDRKPYSRLPKCKLGHKLLSLAKRLAKNDDSNPYVCEMCYDFDLQNSSKGVYKTGQSGWLSCEEFDCNKPGVEGRDYCPTCVAHIYDQEPVCKLGHRLFFKFRPGYYCAYCSKAD